MNCEASWLMSQTLHRQSFLPKSPNDHAHCELCWQRISSYPSDDHEGYTDDAAYRWVCLNCWQERRAAYQWKERQAE